MATLVFSCKTVLFLNLKLLEDGLWVRLNGNASVRTSYCGCRRVRRKREVVPINACTLRITAAAGTELAGASSAGNVNEQRY